MAFGCLGFMLFIALIFATDPGTGSNAASSGSPAKPPVPELQAAALPKGRLIVFASEEPAPMAACEIGLNELDSWSGYSYRFGPVEPGGRRLISQAEFTLGSKRFDPTTQAVSSVTISCDTHEGRRYWGWKKR